MSGANYEYCPGCDNKALYVGEEEVPDGVVVWHETCLATDRAQRAREIFGDIFGLATGHRCSDAFMESLKFLMAKPAEEGSLA